MGILRLAAAAHPRRGRHGAVLAAGIGALLLTVACSRGVAPGSSTVPGDSPPAPAPTHQGPVVGQQWFAARAEALRQGIQNVAPFYAEDAVLDHSALGTAPAEGRTAVLTLLDGAWHPRAWTRTAAEPAYLAPEGAITVERIADRSRREHPLLAGSVALVHDLSESGVQVETLALGTAEVWAQSRNHVRRGPTLEESEALAANYAASWSAADGDAVAALYAGDATVVDGALGIDAHGWPAVAELAVAAPDRGGLPEVALRPMPGSDSPAVYAAGPWTGRAPIDHLVLLLRIPEGARLAVELILDPRGRIVEETRYHRADSLVRSSPGANGWWDEITVPEPVPHVLTGTESLGPVDVEIYNGTPGLAGIVPWAGGRFEAAGLVPPEVVSVAFHDPGVDLCRGINGWIQGGDVVLCYHVRTGCTDAACTGWRPFAKETLLHELSHAWLDQNTDRRIRAEFLELTGKPTWASGAHRWEDRGCELAATTIAWALMDEAFPLNPRMGTLTCAELATRFEALTGVVPAWPPGCEEEP